jgi:AcrR family transcriptional regulator
VADAEPAGRSRQKSRTRKDLLRAAAGLMRDGSTPTIDEVAEAAMVSRATAYRYFSGIEALLVEAALDVAMPEPEALFAGAEPGDPVARLERVDQVVAEMVRANEPALRQMLIHSLQQKLAGGDALPSRQNRRTPLIEAALAPAGDAIRPADRERLARALALVIGTESMIVFKDVLGLGEREADDVRRWMIRSLVQAARGSERPVSR